MMDGNMRVVFDTNIYISALIFSGSYPDFIFRRALRGDFEVYVSNFILKELKQVFKKKFNLQEREANKHIHFISSFAIIKKVKSKINIVKQCPADNKIIALAIDSSADYLVTGDKKHLLPIGDYQGVKILTARNFAETL
jgi:uncharacterized protein